MLVAANIMFAGCKPRPQQRGDAVRGAALYMEKCAVCHGQDGNALLPSCPPLRDSEWLAGPNAPLIAIVLDGMRGPLQVKGRTYNGLMPAWRDVLTDQEVASVLNFLRLQWSETGEPVLPAEVARIRENTSTRQTFWTEGELRAQWPPGRK